MPASTALASLPAPCQPVPRGEKRRREIAAVAEQVFFELGFADTTMQAIAARAGASKETLYRHFGSKEGLFAELFETRARNFLGNLDRNFDRPGSTAAVLREFGCTMLEAMIEPVALCLCRTVIAEAPRNPELGRLFMDHGPERVRGRLADYLRGAHLRGDLSCPDPDLAARIFIGANISSFHLTRLLEADPSTIVRPQIKAHVDEVVTMFLLRYRKEA